MTKDRRTRPRKSDRRDRQMRAARPELSFFCELPSDELARLFLDARVTRLLRELDATLTLGLVDLSPQRANVVRRLNHSGVPVAAWLLLPEEGGYWLNSSNADEAWARYGDFHAWTVEHGLKWTRVGLDIEPNIQDVRAVRHNLLALVVRAVPRLFASVEEARELYQGLIARIRADGYPVDAYVFPFIHTEREAKTFTLQRVTGMLDLEVDREICMLYTSFARPDGPALLDLYGPHFPAVAVGVTGGGVEEGLDVPPPLTWDEFARDLILARRHTRDVHVFSLEGCVGQGFLERLVRFDWTPGVRVPEDAAGRATALTRRIRLALRLLHRPHLAGLGAGAGLAATAGLVAWALRRKRIETERAGEIGDVEGPDGAKIDGEAQGAAFREDE